MNYKYCKSCSETKPTSEFYALPHTTDGLNWRCNQCQNSYNRERHKQLAMQKIDPRLRARFASAPDRYFLRFCRKISIVESGCWNWTGSVHPKTKYGRFWIEATVDRLAHRLAYEWSGRSISPDLEIDHLCRNRQCVNPDHLEMVTSAENLRRSNKDCPRWPIRRRNASKPENSPDSQPVT